VKGTSHYLFTLKGERRILEHLGPIWVGWAASAVIDCSSPFLSAFLQTRQTSFPVARFPIFPQRWLKPTLSAVKIDSIKALCATPRLLPPENLSNFALYVPLTRAVSRSLSCRLLFRLRNLLDYSSPAAIASTLKQRRVETDSPRLNLFPGATDLGSSFGLLTRIFGLRH